MSLSPFPVISDLFVTYLLLATLPILLRPSYYIPLHPIPSYLMTDMPWTKNGESAAASWNGNRYRDASAPPPAVNVPRKYSALISDSLPRLSLCFFP